VADGRQEELDELEALAAEVGSEWSYGEAMIPYDDFTDYVRELAEDRGFIQQDTPHWIVIDWEATAEAVMADYTQVDYNGETYLVRA